MNSIKQEKLKSLNDVHLPVLPTGIPELLSLLTKQDTSFEMLSDSIERFPTITARLIATANSAWSSPVEPIESLQEACSRLGFSVVKNICIALAVASPFSVHQCPSFNIKRFWCRALLVADIASSISKLLKPKLNEGIIRTTGLLHNLGLLWLADQMPTEVEECLLLCKNTEGLPLSEALESSIGFDYTDAGAFLGTAWSLPSSLIEALSSHNKVEEYLANGISSTTLGLSVALAQAIEIESEEFGESQQKIQTIVDALSSSLDINNSNVQSLIVQSRLLFVKNQELSNSLY